jgi:hypothetical protein
MTVATRLTRLEGRLGGNDTERWLRSLTDEELDAEIAELVSEAKGILAARGVDCADLSTSEVAAHLADLGRPQNEINQVIPDAQRPHPHC